jgi:hypothetical protein
MHQPVPATSRLANSDLEGSRTGNISALCFRKAAHIEPTKLLVVLTFLLPHACYKISVSDGVLQVHACAACVSRTPLKACYT